MGRRLEFELGRFFSTRRLWILRGEETASMATDSSGVLFDYERGFVFSRPNFFSLTETDVECHRLLTYTLFDSSFAGNSAHHRFKK